jgi:hypothetical protein
MVLTFLFTACSTNIVIDYIEEDLLEFTLTDVNPNSNWFDEEISTLDFVNASPEKISAWYFGHST